MGEKPPRSSRLSIILRPTVAPWLFALAFTLLILIPPGLHGKTFSAPLESYPVMLTLLGAWLLAWVASAFSYPRLAYIIALGLPLVFLLLKLMGTAILPPIGLEARITSPDPHLQTAPTRSPFRPTGPSGWPLYNSPVIAPHFINDIRRFDDQALSSNARNDIPFTAHLRGYVKATSGTVLIPDKKLTDVRVTTAPVRAGFTFDFQAAGRSGDFICRPLFRLTSPNAHARPPTYFPQVNTTKSVTILIGTLLSDFNGFGYLSAAAIAMAVMMVPRHQSLWRKIIIGALPVLVMIGASKVPISLEGDLSQILPSALIATLLLLLPAIVITRLWSHLTPAHHRAWHALLILAWSTIAMRFYMDRYPSGFAILAGGSDTLFHYTFASEILRGDWLHRADAPFTRQLGMRYIIAPFMALFGEGPVYSIYANTIAYGLISLLLASILRTTGIRCWALAPVIWIALFFISPFKTWVPTLFPEVMSILFLLASLDQLCKWHYRGRLSSNWRVFASAVWMSLAIFTRNNYLLIIPFATLLILFNPAKPRFGWKHPDWRPAIIFAAIVCIMIGLVALRNTALAKPGEPFALLLSKNISDLALYQGFNPAFIGDANLQQQYGHLSLKNQFLATIAERPGLYLRYIADRLLVLLGGPATIEPNLLTQYPKFHPVNMLLFGGTCFFGIMRLWRRQRPNFIELLSWMIILPQIALVIFMIGYVGEGYRFLLPCYPFLIIILAAAFDQKARPLLVDAQV